MVSAIEQQMSAECIPGWMAFSAATTPPTGIVPAADPAGQASGMMAPARIVGTRISSIMWRSTAAILASSSGCSAEMLMRCASPPGSRSGITGGGANCSTTTRISASSAPERRAASAAAIALGNHGPGT